MATGIIVAGCRGREDCGVQLCGGTSFDLFDMDLVDPSDANFYNYVLKLMRLDKGAITDYNSVISTINFIRPYIHSNKYDAVCEWIRVHKQCGVYLYRRFNE